MVRCQSSKKRWLANGLVEWLVWQVKLLAGACKGGQKMIYSGMFHREPISTITNTLQELVVAMSSMLYWERADTMHLSDILQADCVKVPLDARTKEEAIYEMVDLLCDRTGIEARQQLKDTVWQREKTRTTGIGHGIAIPHGRSAHCQRLSMVVGKPSEPIEFGSVDGRPVDLIVLLVSRPEQTGPQIQALAAISRLMAEDQFRAVIKQASTSDEVYQLIVAREAAQSR